MIRARRSSQDPIYQRPIGGRLSARKGTVKDLKGRGSPKDTPALVGGYLTRAFKAALKRANLPEGTRFHDLRYTCATILLRQGVNPKYVQDLLGHADISLTLNVYSHVLPDMGDAAAGAMDAALG